MHLVRGRASPYAHLRTPQIQNSHAQDDVDPGQRPTGGCPFEHTAGLARASVCQFRSVSHSRRVQRTVANTVSIAGEYMYAPRESRGNTETPSPRLDRDKWPAPVRKGKRLAVAAQRPAFQPLAATPDGLASHLHSSTSMPPRRPSPTPSPSSSPHGGATERVLGPLADEAAPALLTEAPSATLAFLEPAFLESAFAWGFLRLTGTTTLENPNVSASWRVARRHRRP